jgi:Protein of unknown function (DUF998)
MDARGSTRWLLLAGVIGPLLFVVVFLVEGWTRAGYDPQRMFVSQLSLSGQGWQQVANFIVTGLLFVAAAIGWRRAMPDGPGCRSVPILLGMAGIGLIAAGIFVTDPGLGYPPGAPTGMPTTSSWHDLIHGLASILVFVGLPIAMLIMWRRFSLEGGRWALYALLSAIGMVAAFMSAFAFADILGVLQRVSIVIGFGWVARVSWRFRAELREEARDG